MQPKSVDLRDQLYLDIIERYEKDFPEFDSATNQMVWRSVNAYHLLLSVTERRLAEFGLSPQAVDVLIILSVCGEEGRPLREIGELLLVSRANVTGMIEGLVRKGLVSRSEDTGDRRKRIARLTPQAREIINNFLPKLFLMLREIFSGMPAEDKNRVSELLTEMARLMLAHREREQASRRTRAAGNPRMAVMP